MSDIITFPNSLREKMANDDTGGYPHIGFSAGDGLEFTRVHLYVPQGLSVSDGANYAGVDLGMVRAGKGFIDQVIAKDEAGNLDNMTSTDESFVVGLKVLDKLGVDQSATAAAGIERGVAFNPQTALAFESVNLRQFSFTFTLVPESLEESRDMRRIENFFRKYLYPEVKGFVAKYPPKFKIQFFDGGAESPYMPMIHDCYLAGMEVQVNPEGNSYHVAEESYYAPASMNMTLNFSEARMLSRHDLYKKQASLGPRYDYSRPNSALQNPSPQGEGGNG